MKLKNIVSKINEGFSNFGSVADILSDEFYQNIFSKTNSLGAVNQSKKTLALFNNNPHMLKAISNTAEKSKVKAGRAVVEVSKTLRLYKGSSLEEPLSDNISRLVEYAPWGPTVINFMNLFQDEEAHKIVNDTIQLYKNSPFKKFVPKTISETVRKYDLGKENPEGLMAITSLLQDDEIHESIDKILHQCKSSSLKEHVSETISKIARENNNSRDTIDDFLKTLYLFKDSPFLENVSKTISTIFYNPEVLKNLRLLKDSYSLEDNLEAISYSNYEIRAGDVEVSKTLVLYKSSHFGKYLSHKILNFSTGMNKAEITRFMSLFQDKEVYKSITDTVQLYKDSPFEKCISENILYDLLKFDYFISPKEKIIKLTNVLQDKEVHKSINDTIQLYKDSPFEKNVLETISTIIETRSKNAIMRFSNLLDNSRNIISEYQNNISTIVKNKSKIDSYFSNELVSEFTLKEYSNLLNITNMIKTKNPDKNAIENFYATLNEQLSSKSSLKKKINLINNYSNEIL